MEAQEPYGDAVEQFLRLGFSPEIHKWVTSIVEHHVLSDPDVPLTQSVRVATVIMIELYQVSRANHSPVAAVLGRKLMDRVVYWEGTSRLRHGTFDGPDAMRLTPGETTKLFYTLRHIADTLLNVITDVPVYKTPLTPQ